MAMNTNRIIELTLVFFISLFSFSIGTFVGKKYSDNQHRLSQLEPQKNEAADNQQTATDSAIDAIQAVNPVESTEDTLSDADVAQLAEEFSTDESTAPVEKTTAVAAPAASNSKDVKEISLADSETARDVASIPAKTQTQVAGSSASASPLKYTVQVGAYPTADDADKMTTSLNARGYKANTTVAKTNGKTWYKVQVGLFDSLTEAQTYKKELVEKNRLSSAFVQKVTN